VRPGNPIARRGAEPSRLLSECPVPFTRRRLVKAAAAAVLAAAASPLSCARQSAPRKTLRIIQWSHFVPRYDRWFDRVFTKEWGAKNNTDIVIDHMSATEVPARGAAEAAAGKGHDLFHFLTPPAAYERHVLDHADVVREVEKRHGKMIPLARKSTFNEKTGKFFAFSDSYVPDPGNYRIDLWSEAGYPKGPGTWEELRIGGRKIKDKFGSPVGIGFSQEMDSNMALRALLWSFGGAEQDETGRPMLHSRETIEALKFARALYHETETPEVFTWDPSSNNRAILSGRSSFIQNAISVTRTAEKENPAIARKIGLTTALRGPVRRIAAEHLMSCYVIWKFAENPDGARQFLVDLVSSFASVFRESEFYSFPCYPTTVPDLGEQLAKDPRADPPGKYAVLSDVLDWATNVGFPGSASAAVDEVFNTFVIPTMFARAARGEATPEEAARAGDAEVRRIFGKWN
jgi:multiple sugar transport system substrate-binding protein